MRKFKHFFENDFIVGHNPYSPTVLQEKKEKSIDDLERELEQEVSSIKNDASSDSAPAENAEEPAAIPADDDNAIPKNETDPSKQDIQGPQPVDATATAPNPQDKITTMFSETGDVKYDYSLANENNVSLSVFKFTQAGIDILKLVPVEILDPGLPAEDAELRLTAEQKDSYKQSNRLLRATYPAIDKREKYIIIHNTNIPMRKKNENGEDVSVPNSQLKAAYEKINAYMESKFGLAWQDKQKAKTYLKSIKINFSDKPYVRMNVTKITEAFPVNNGEPIAFYDKLMIENPAWLEEFISKNKNDEQFKASSIFRSISNSYNDQEGDSVCVILNTKKVKDFGSAEEAEDTEDVSSNDDISSNDTDTPEDEESDTSDDTSPADDITADIEGESAEPGKAGEEVTI